MSLEMERGEKGKDVPAVQLCDDIVEVAERRGVWWG